MRSIGKVQVATFTAGQPTAIAAGSADVVLTFRNVHNWLDGGRKPDCRARCSPDVSRC